MSVSKKGRRRIVVDDTPYWWHVSREHSGGYNIDMPAVHIISDDKSLDVFYRLNQGHIMDKAASETPTRRIHRSFPEFMTKPVVEVRRGLAGKGL